jgi:hypothetical protein
MIKTHMRTLSSSDTMFLINLYMSYVYFLVTASSNRYHIYHFFTSPHSLIYSPFLPVCSFPSPLSPQVNDPTPRCREAAADVIASLARRVDPDIVSTFIRYSMKWLSSSVGGTGSAGGNAQARALVRTGSQVAGLMVTTRPDLFKKLGFVMQAVASVRATLVTLLRVMEGAGEKRGSLEKRETSKHDEGQGDGGGAESWAVSYHLLVLIEKYVLHCYCWRLGPQFHYHQLSRISRA